MRAIIFTLSLALCFHFAFSQENYDADSVHYTPIPKETKAKQKSKEVESIKGVEYFFNVQFGSLAGCNDCGNGKDFTFSTSTQHGVLIGKKLRTSVGIGFDSYLNWQTLPLFTSASWDLIGNRNKNAVFLQLSYGWSHPWFVKSSQYSYYTSDPFTDVDGGRMINPQIGYRIKYYDLRIALSLGYKYQRISYKVFGYGSCPACDFPNWYDVTQDMNRFQMNMVVGWR